MLGIDEKYSAGNPKSKFVSCAIDVFLGLFCFIYSGFKRDKFIRPSHFLLKEFSYNQTFYTKPCLKSY